MKKHHKIFGVGLLFAYLFFSYGAIDNTMNQRTFQGKQLNCRQIAPHHAQPQDDGNSVGGKFISSCEPLELLDWRAAGGALWPYQQDILLSAEDYLQRNYWRNVALLTLGLSSVPWLFLLLRSLVRRWRDYLQRKPRKY